MENEYCSTLPTHENMILRRAKMKKIFAMRVCEMTDRPIRKWAMLIGLAASLVGGLSGCGGRTILGGDPKLEVVLDASNLPAPTREDFEIITDPYFVGPLDRLTIDVYGISELSKREVQVDTAGMFSFPLAGNLYVSGMSTKEIEAELTARLRKAYIRNPEVSVNLQESLSRVLTIEGEVKAPGVYPLINRTTLLGALARAQGLTEFSKLDDIVVFRTVRGQRYAALYNLEQIRRGAYPDPPVYPNDIVMVGDSEGRRLFKDILTSVPALVLPVVIAIERLSQ